MIELALAGLIAFATVPAASPAPMVEQVQFRGGPGGQCPDGYDFSLPIGQIDEEIAIIEAGLSRLKSETSTAI